MTDNRSSFLDAGRTLQTDNGDFLYFSFEQLEKLGLGGISRLPRSIRILLESVVRNQGKGPIVADDVKNLAAYQPKSVRNIEVPFMPARVLLQDFTGVPAMVDLAAMRSAMARLGGDPEKINPLIPLDLVVDHSVQIDYFASSMALRMNTEMEFKRNRERYEFLAWGQKAFQNFRVVPPESGICHQINLEYLSRVVRTETINGKAVAFPDTLVGTDSHTPMVNGLGVVGWGVGGIEAEAVMLGQPMYMLAPEVVGFELVGELPAGTTATDLVLTVTQLLRKEGVVGKFVEFYGDGLATMSVEDRATISNMSPECGSTIGHFPVDERTLEYLRDTNRGDIVDLVERYSKAQGLFRYAGETPPEFARTVQMDLGSVESSLAGPNRPHDRVPLEDLKRHWRVLLDRPQAENGFGLDENQKENVAVVEFDDGSSAELTHGAVVIAAITSCTNTSNPSVMLGAGLLAQKAVELGLTRKPWVKSSLAPGSKVATDYLARSGLLPSLETLGFHVVGYGCTTCIGNGGPLPEDIRAAVVDNGLVAASVLSGNRNFEGRVSQEAKASWLASPPLVVAYALAGTVEIDLVNEPLGLDKNGNPVFLAEIWPTAKEINDLLGYARSAETFKARYDGIETSNKAWNDIPVKGAQLYEWSDASTYIQEPPFFADMTMEVDSIKPINGARALVKVGDSITTDHISPAGGIPADGPAGTYLQGLGVEKKDFNSFGSRRGNDRVMTRGTFANIRLRNQLAPGTEGGWTTYVPTGEVTSVYDAAERYKADNVPTIVLAGADYGMGSSRDWAAKGAQLLGVKAVIATTYERIHRANLIGMGVLPLQFLDGDSHEALGLTGHETFDINIDESLAPGQEVKVTATRSDGTALSFNTLCRIDSSIDGIYYRNGGILQTVLRDFLK